MLVPVGASARQTVQPSPQRAGDGAASGGITLQAFVQRHDRSLMADDTDGDGKVDRTEFLAAAKRGKVDPARRFAKIDRNRDGMIDQAEIDAMLTARFKRLDTNGNGILEPAERTAVHAKRTRGAGAGV
ncbi:signal transduction protein [Sphingomonas koreensis]|nr:signal transduction protein [Sphingomonas koreensis]